MALCLCVLGVQVLPDIGGLDTSVPSLSRCYIALVPRCFGIQSSAFGTQFSPLHLPLSPARSILCTQTPATQAHSCSSSPPRSSKRSRHSRQAKDNADLKSQMAQVLARQQAVDPAPAPAPPLALASAPPLAIGPDPTLSPLVVSLVVPERDEVSTEDHDALCIEAS
ncbi:UNVERIFIED_CONTAM: hypothetical protein FKN15_045355 [Acipenser sinensis]